MFEWLRKVLRLNRFQLVSGGDEIENSIDENEDVFKQRILENFNKIRANKEISDCFFKLSHLSFFSNSTNKQIFLNNLGIVLQLLRKLDLLDYSTKRNCLLLIATSSVNCPLFKERLFQLNGLRVLIECLARSENDEKLTAFTCYALCYCIYDNLDCLKETKQLFNNCGYLLDNAAKLSIWNKKTWQYNYAIVLSNLIGHNIIN